jgi:hypothetical protein
MQYGEKMKKNLTVLVLILFAVSFAFAKQSEYDGEFIVKAGFQAQGILHENDSDKNTKPGFSVAAEAFKYFSGIFALGLGASYDFPRKFSDDAMKHKLSFLPIYIGAKLRTPLLGLDNNFMFVSGRLGYSSVIIDNSEHDNFSGGAYYALGIGFNIDILLIEAIYAKNHFTETSKDQDYQTITLYAGIKFE